ncbi:MAG: hypothetical protein GY759_16315 [Chloroflexi bacterium]|nr:hypothetical protein [Chloroflexota bacterium]
MTEGISLYSRADDERVAFETRTRALYFDFLPAAMALQRAFIDDVLERGIVGRRTERR